MTEAPKKFYLTTPIYYVNARPHIGHAYSTIAADVLARRHRLLGEEVFFLTGTDEHGQKVQRSAAAAGVPPQQFTDEVSASFRALWQRMGILDDSLSKDDPLLHRDFIRTTEPRHKVGVQKLWRQLEASGDIYLDSYTGAYCVSDEAFVDLPAGTPCPDCGRPLEIVTEENYFFRLSAYQQKVIDLIESGTLHIQPEGVRNEVLSFLRSGLKDLSISRTTFDWGIKVPGNPRHVIYVWLDALANYITAIGYGAEDRTDLSEAEKQKELAKFARFWPADIHLVGKEITRFHCVYWPAFLMAARLPTPKSVVANGWLLFEESKMSKSRGNVVRTETILDAFGDHYRASIVAQNKKLAADLATASSILAEPSKRDCDLFASDVLRYFLLREIPFGQDGSFSFDALITRYNADLANGYGNLVSRTLAMIGKRGGLIPQEKNAALDPNFMANDVISYSAIRSGVAEFGDETDKSNFSSALQKVGAMITLVDGYMTQYTPWKLVGSADRIDQYKADHILYTAAESIRIITALLYPVMPHTTAKVWAQLGLGNIEDAARSGQLKDLKWGGLKPGTKLGPLAPIFPRADKGLAQIMIDMESTNNPPKPAESAPASSAETTQSAPPQPGTSNHEPGTSPTITIDDFAKVDLRVARVLVAERIPKADKLLRLEVDLGYEKRQVLAGIAEHYAPETLIGRKVVIVANLAPRKLRGFESQGMVVAASVGPDGAPVLAGFLEDVEIGARLK